MSAPCPDRDALRRFLAGLSPADEQSRLEAHLDECDECQATLDALGDGDDSWLGRVKDLGPGPTESMPGLKRVMGALKDEPDADADADATGFAAVTPGEILVFLDPPEAPGDLGKLASYRVLEVLRSGGMGIVLKAVDPALNRTVAVKVLAPQLAASGSARRRFAREARAAAAVRNEHVVAIHSVDEWKGLPYLVMEFIPGASLQDRIDRTGPLDLTSILRIGTQAATGLAAAHAQGLVHRDIKPSNILLENCIERVKITDFGLARAVDDASLTQSGVVAGTPLFMAPEQARCEAIDHRADLFSLGAVLYAMCTGRPPFRAPTTLGVLRRVCDDAHRPIREVNPEIPSELAAVIDRLLAKEPDRRIQTAAETAGILGRLLARRQQGWTGAGDGESVHTPADDVGPVKRPRRRRLLQAAACLVVLLSGAFVVAEGTGTTRVIDAIATVLRIKTPDGTLLLEVYDPAAVVEVDGVRVSIKGLGLSSFTLEPGAHRVDKIDGQGNASTEWISIQRGDKLLVKVGREPDQSPGVWPRTSTNTITPTVKTEVKDLRGQLAFMRDGRYLVGAGPGAEIGVYDARAGTVEIHAIEGGDVKALEVNDEIHSVLTASADGKVRFWDLFSLAEGDRPVKPLATPDWHGQHVTALAMTRDGRLLALGSADGKLVVWDRKTKLRDDLAVKLGHPVAAVKFSHDNSQLAVGLMGGGVKVWNIVPNEPSRLDKPLREYGGEYGEVKEARLIDFSRGGEFLAVADARRCIIVSRQDEKILGILGFVRFLPSDIRALSFSSRRGLLGLGLDDPSFVLWDVDRNQQICRIQPNPLKGDIVGLAFSPDGLTLATCGLDDDSTKIWELSTRGASSPLSIEAGALNLKEQYRRDQRAMLSREIKEVREELERVRQTARAGEGSGEKTRATEEMLKKVLQELSGRLQNLDERHREQPAGNAVRF